jgi:hypothetical protein
VVHPGVTWPPLCLAAPSPLSLNACSQAGAAAACC